MINMRKFQLRSQGRIIAGCAAVQIECAVQQATRHFAAIFRTGMMLFKPKQLSPIKSPACSSSRLA